MLNFNLNNVRDSLTSVKTQQFTSGGTAPPTSLTGLAVGLLQPQGFDNLVASLGLGKLFGHSSPEHFNQAGAREFAPIVKKFEETVKTNPELALNNLDKEFNTLLAKFVKMTRNAPSRIKGDLQISLNYLNDRKADFQSILNNFKKVFEVETQSFNDVRRGQPFTYNKYVLTPRTVDSSKKIKTVLADVSTTDSVENENVKNNKINKWLKYAFIALLPFGLIVLGIFKLIKKKRK